MSSATDTPHYASRAERTGDWWMHCLSLISAFIGGPLLIGIALQRGDAALVISVSVYALCLLIMFGVSAAYNLSKDAARRKQLRRMDHAAIFLMIAGTYTPFTTQSLEGGWSFGMTLAVWSLALLSAAGKLALPNLFNRIWIFVYVLLGWLVMIAIGPLAAALPPAALTLLVIGGAVYTIGALIYAARAFPLRRAIWHGFVLIAASAHFAAIMVGVVLA